MEWFDPLLPVHGDLAPTPSALEKALSRASAALEKGDDTQLLRNVVPTCLNVLHFVATCITDYIDGQNRKRSTRCAAGIPPLHRTLCSPRLLAAAAMAVRTLIQLIEIRSSEDLRGSLALALQHCSGWVCGCLKGAKTLAPHPPQAEAQPNQPDPPQQQELQAGQQHAAMAAQARPRSRLRARQGTAERLLQGLRDSSIVQVLCSALLSVPAGPVGSPSAGALSVDTALWQAAKHTFHVLQLLSDVSKPLLPSLVLPPLAAPEVQRLLRAGLQRLAIDGGVAAAGGGSGGGTSGRGGQQAATDAAAAPLPWLRSPPRSFTDGEPAGEEEARPTAPGRERRDGAGAHRSVESAGGEADAGARRRMFSELRAAIRHAHGRLLTAAATVWETALCADAYAIPMPSLAQLPRLLAPALEGLHRMRTGAAAAGLYALDPGGLPEEEQTAHGLMQLGLLVMLACQRGKSNAPDLRAWLADCFKVAAWGLALLAQEAAYEEQLDMEAFEPGEESLLQGAAITLLGSVGVYRNAFLEAFQDCKAGPVTSRIIGVVARTRLLRSLDAALRLQLQAHGSSSNRACKHIWGWLALLQFWPGVLDALLADQAGGSAGADAWDASRDLGVFLTCAKAARRDARRLEALLSEAAAGAAAAAAPADQSQQGGVEVSKASRDAMDDVAQWVQCCAILLKSLLPEALLPKLQDRLAASPRHVVPDLYELYESSDSVLELRADVRAVVQAVAATCIRASAPLLSGQAALQERRGRHERELAAKSAADAMRCAFPCAAAFNHMVRHLPAEALTPAAPLAFLAAYGRALSRVPWHASGAAEENKGTSAAIAAAALAYAAAQEELSGQVRAALREAAAASAAPGPAAPFTSAAAASFASSVASAAASALPPRQPSLPPLLRPPPQPLAAAPRPVARAPVRPTAPLRRPTATPGAVAVAAAQTPFPRRPPTCVRCCPCCRACTPS